MLFRSVPLLAAHFLQQLNNKHRTKKRFNPTVFETVLTYPFPGNVRELQNAVERGFFGSKTASIDALPVDSILPSTPLPIDEVHTWFRDLSEGRANFWTAVHDRYKNRDISRESVVALFDLGLRKTRGSYKGLTKLFHIEPYDYRRLMDFLRRNDCHLDYRPYRHLSHP